MIKHQNKSLSSEIINQVAKFHYGVKINKLKMKEISNRRPIFSKPRSKETTKEDVKNAFVHHITKVMMSKNNISSSINKSDKY